VASRNTLAALGGLALALATSGAEDAQGSFRRGLAALHNFSYEEALIQFREAQEKDAGFAMAYWGEAMACNQSLWLNQDRDAARAALARLAPTPEQRARKAASEKERGLLAAVEVLYGDGDKPARDLAYAEAMRRIYAGHPDDPDVASLYALALLATAIRSPALYSEANEEAHQHALVGSETQARVAGILEKVLRVSPQHPGALHYTIHNYDDPGHAKLALPASRAYAKAAPESSHALHMPAHIFLQLGSWAEAAASDEASFAQSIAWTKRRGLGIGLRDYHSLSWLCYEALQQGRFQKARETLELVQPAVAETGAARLKALSSVMRAQYVIETRSWEMLRGRQSFDTSAELFAIGLSAAERGQVDVATLARNELGRRAQGRKLDAAIMEKELAALVELRAGRGAQAIALMQEAAALEKELPPPLGPPRPIKPSYELQGEILLELLRPQDAARAFQQSLSRWPNRSASLLGLARAQAAAGDAVAARAQYQRLLSNWSRADIGVNGLDEARRAVAGGK
jgi:tetratricopeptide (TPR) repeat protein